MNDKLFKYAILVLIIVFLLVIIRSTYAKYRTGRETGAQLRIAQWNIKINDEDISENSDFSELIDLVYDENPNIANEVIAPTSTGYFIVNLESTGTELPFDYEFSMDVSDSAVSDYRIISYLKYDGTSYHNPLTSEELAALKADTEHLVELESSSSTITGEVDPGATLTTPVITSFIINFGWYDGENELLNNTNDVQTSKVAHSSNPHGTGVIDLNLTVTQKEDVAEEPEVPVDPENP